ncbi:MAG: metallophosphoesterase family protein [Planctomycetaceae bacterium]|nr:metallophosphoesterase family protein [Planctomycetaceae bacterium]
MRILLIADIHANWAAFSAVINHVDGAFDYCLCLGDLVDYGTDPHPCVNWIRNYADAVVRGNHDHALAQRVPAVGTSGLRRLAAMTRPLNRHQLDPSQIEFLRQLPVSRYFQVAGSKFYLVHATPRDPMDEYLGPDRERWKPRIEGIDAQFLCVGHSHTPFHLSIGDRQVINPGSVGQPRDGDWRASYAMIDEGKVEFHRVSYDLDACISQMKTTGMKAWAIELALAVLKSGGQMTREEMDAIRPDGEDVPEFRQTT